MSLAMSKRYISIVYTYRRTSERFKFLLVADVAINKRVNRYESYKGRFKAFMHVIFLYGEIWENLGVQWGPIENCGILQ
jgi:hypothetical protein